MVSPTTGSKSSGSVRKGGGKKPLSAYHQFMKDEIPKYKTKNPEAPHKEVFKKVAEMWKGAKSNPATQIG
jgi:hypothetical protein